MRKRVFLILFIPLVLFAQENGGKDVWEPLRYFVGSWTGESTGKAGDGKGERTCEFIMEGTYLHYKTVMHFEPQEKNPEGEVHEDWVFFSFDQNRNSLVVRQFNTEGFVNQYVLDSLSSDGSRLVLTTEHSENAPPGLMAKYTLEIKNADEFVENFELGFSGKGYSCWMTNTWYRKEN
ncbi:MAG: hypothetical protein JSV84_04630 [Gemmatimonadota bacterium]|nr:MAG: hypothetical protein JSV84_04630 [Gemmatimonadota bacterium]